MKKLSVFNHVTVDGLVAGPDGEIDWFQSVHDDEWKRYAQKHADLSRHTLMFGHTTYAMMKSWWPTLVAMQHGSCHGRGHEPQPKSRVFKAALEY